MAKIAVFDSGLGSLSVIRPLQERFKCGIIYFADSENFPYGRKSVTEIRAIALKTVSALQALFEPDLVIVGSNTLSLALDSHPKDVQTVLPPLDQAINITKTKSVAILATESIVKSQLLDRYVQKFSTERIKIIKINASKLVELVEDGIFYSDPQLCKSMIKKTLHSKFRANNIDVAMLSSTHLPFLLEPLEGMFPHMTFLDPSESLARKLKRRCFDTNRQRNTLQIFTSGDVESFKNKLCHLGIKNSVYKLAIK